MTHAGGLDSPVEERDVLIVGGGVAGIEALMALADLGDNRLRLQLVADRASFVLPPEILGVPWGATPLHVDLERLCRAFGARFELGTVTGVDAGAHEAYLAGGETVAYERLLLAPGARHALPYGADTRTLGFGMLPHALAADASGTVVVVVPDGASWTLPAYQLALLCAGHGRDVQVLTGEAVVLESFGPATTAAVRALLQRHGVIVHTGRAPAPGTSIAGMADTVIALPLLEGPSITGLALAERGFLRADERGAAPGLEHVYVAGDATDGPIKQGGLAAQQADTAAAEIVRSCGGRTAPTPYAPVIRGRLTSYGGEELYLRRALDGQDQGATSTDPLWRPPGAICAWRLARWLDYHRDTLQSPAPDRPLTTNTR